MFWGFFFVTLLCQFLYDVAQRCCRVAMLCVCSDLSGVALLAPCALSHMLYGLGGEHTGCTSCPQSSLPFFFWRREYRPHESERALLTRVHRNIQYTGSNARQPHWCLHHVVRRRWKNTSESWLSDFLWRISKHWQELLSGLGLQSCQCFTKGFVFPHKPLMPSTEASLQYRTELCFPFPGIPISQIITCCYTVIKSHLQSVCLTVIWGLNPLQQIQTSSDNKICLSSKSVT